MGIQNYFRRYDYIHESQKMLFDFYSKHALSFLVTYWNINQTKTVWDNDTMMGGSYERIGQLSGTRWDRYLLLPVYFPDEISVSFDGNENGYVKEQETTVTIPSTYNITPYPGDIVKLEQGYLQNNDNHPIFIVTNCDIHPNTDKRFWKLKLQVFQSRTVDEILLQTQDTYVFFEYDKNIYPIDQATELAKLLSKNVLLKDQLLKMWDPNKGFYTS